MSLKNFLELLPESLIFQPDYAILSAMGLCGFAKLPKFLCHSGRTDGAGGHYVYEKSKLVKQSYHYHHGKEPHLHPMGYVHTEQRFFGIELTGRNDAFYLASNGEKNYIENFYGTDLSPKNIKREDSPWSGATGGIDFLVDEECFKDLIKRYCTGDIADKYYASEGIKIRATPYGQQIDGTKIFIPGAIVKTHESKETQKVDGSDNIWIKVYYDVNKSGWVAKEFLAELPKPVVGHAFQYNWDKSQYVTQDFKDKVTGVAKELIIDPDDLMAVMAFESGFNPAQKNSAGGSATGLVQFMPNVAEELHTTIAELEIMSGVEQLDYVYGYFYPHKEQLSTLGDIYMRVLWPNAIGKDEDYILYSKGSINYDANASLDGSVDGIVDGDISKKEAVQAVINNKQEYM